MQKLQMTILPDYDAMSRTAADYIFGKITEKLHNNERFVLGMATGNSPVGLYKALLELFKGYKGSLGRFYTVNLDEYYPMSKNDPNSYFSYMAEKFWEPLSGLSGSFNLYKQGYIPSGEAEDAVAECAAYEEKIRELGGVDLQILGIGTNGHIGFNEPGSPGDSRTRVVELAESTIQDNAMHFGGDATKVPPKAITMGVGTILEAREIVVLASGASKAPIVKALTTESEPNVENPASFLFTHNQVKMFVDKAASGE